MRRIDAMVRARERYSGGSNCLTNSFAPAAQLVSCPSCGETVASKDMNSHLDGCLSADMFASEPETPVGEVEVARKEGSEGASSPSGDNGKANKGHSSILRERVSGMSGRQILAEQRSDSTHEISKGPSCSSTCFEEKPWHCMTSVTCELTTLFEVSDEQLAQAMGLHCGTSDFDGGPSNMMRVTEELANQMARIQEELNTISRDMQEPHRPLPDLDSIGRSRADEKKREQLEEEAIKEIQIIRAKTGYVSAPSEGHGLRNQESNTCPVCGIRVSNVNLQVHIQTCLEASGLGDAFQ